MNSCCTETTGSQGEYQQLRLRCNAPVEKPGTWQSCGSSVTRKTAPNIVPDRVNVLPRPQGVWADGLC